MTGIPTIRCSSRGFGYRLCAGRAERAADGRKNVRTWDQAGLYFYRFNVKMEPFQNEKIRKAFAAAIDQKEITDYVTKNSEKPAHAFVSPGFTQPDGKDFREARGSY